MLLSKLKPSVPARFLVLLAGLFWTLAGLLLCWNAFFSLSGLHHWKALMLGTGAALLSVVAGRFIFAPIVTRNLKRLAGYDSQRCLFAFQTWRSYPLVALMILLGVAVRHTGMPSEPLAVIQTVMGGALITASIQYYRAFGNT